MSKYLVSFLAQVTREGEDPAILKIRENQVEKKLVNREKMVFLHSRGTFHSLPTFFSTFIHKCTDFDKGPTYKICVLTYCNIVDKMFTVCMLTQNNDDKC